VVLASGLVLLLLAGRGAVEPRAWTPIGPVADGVGVAVASVTLDRTTATLYAGKALDQGAPPVARIFRRAGQGADWVETASPELGGFFPSVEVVADGTGAVYAGVGSCLIHPPLGCGGGLARTQDGGATWTVLHGRATGRVTIDPADSAAILSTALTTQPDPIFPGHVTVVTSGLRSADHGATWIDISELRNPSSFAFDPTRPGTVLATTLSDGVWMSADDGASWAAVSVGLSGDQLGAIAIDASGTVYVAAVEGVIMSSDGGVDWVLTGLHDAARALFADPSPAGGVYAGGASGVFHLDESGFAIPLGTGVSNVSSLAADDRHVWASTPEGVFEYDLRRPHPRLAPARR
jgi:hypothetical protein